MCACVHVRARGCGTPICTLCVCIDACASRHVRLPGCAHAHTHRRLRLRLSVAISSCMHVRMDIHACVYRWLGMDRCASVFIGLYLCIYNDIYIRMIYLCCTHTYARTHACVHTGIDMCVYPDRCHAYRWVHVYQSPSVPLNMLMYGHLPISRHMYFGAASRRACGRAVVAVARADAPIYLHGFGPFEPTSAHCRAAGAGRTRARCAAGTSTSRR
jgi:hypothetical protein